MPFFPQSRYQCGPAALATTLWHSGVDVDAEALAPAVYLPAREGSLQPELLAAVRRHGRVPYRIPGTVDALLEELTAGRPVLVLQNQGFAALPRWHYAVVVAYDAHRGQWVLRSGTEGRRRESHALFLLGWSRAERWAIVTARPGELPATVTPDEALRALADAEGLLRPEAALAAWETSLSRWPDHGDIRFATANAARRAGRDGRAATLYRQLLDQRPAHLAARNNYADLLLARGCHHRASTVIAPALEQSPASPGLGAALRDTARAISRAAASAPAISPCPLGD
ncbi:PA2778 family cysteine peptidase [Parahaliea mediterranea]|uniref:PA2778 family cysteine peptidase n=1 Tax=Parahaliea mediterranea TaxID=651086 RepID=A0A939DC61_9GAMM|nr:PA2778 family cysteine peptidase [Parahaliea mediterranea]